jgi:hypothetical protein
LQEFSFHLNTTRRYYSCSNLHSKITAILEAVGASDVAVELSCSGLTSNASARIAALSPVPATAENVQAATTHDSQTTLVARLRRSTLPTAETIQRFPAEWRSVSLMRTRGLQLEAQDCDLLQDISEQILPRLSVRIVKERLSCDLMSVKTARPTLVVEALMRRTA